eukprot:Opistho-2@73775
MMATAVDAAPLVDARSYESPKRDPPPPSSSAEPSSLLQQPSQVPPPQSLITTAVDVVGPLSANIVIPLNLTSTPTSPASSLAPPSDADNAHVASSTLGPSHSTASQVGNIANESSSSTGSTGSTGSRAGESNSSSGTAAVRRTADGRAVPYLEPPVSSFEFEWRRADAVLKRARLNASKPPPPPLRVSQLDALRLDHELMLLLKAQFSKIFTFFKQSRVERMDPELNMLLQLLIYWLSVYKSDATYGQSLLNLKYGISVEDPRPITQRRKALQCALMVCGPWLWSRMNNALVAHGWIDRDDDDWRRKVWIALDYGEKAFRVASLLNLFAFLYDGKHHTLVDRLLGIRLVHARRLRRVVSFEFMDRQLLWNGFAELLLFLIPLINIQKIKTHVVRSLFPNSGVDGAASILSATACGICFADPANTPYVAIPCTLR